MSQHILIDQFTVPSPSKGQFLERMQINRSFIKTLPGFIKDMAYEQTTENGQHKFITLAFWESEEAFTQAKKAVSELYQKQGFNLAQLLNQLQIQMERGVYSPLGFTEE